MCETHQYVCIRDVIFTSFLSKGAKLFYGALDRLPAYVEDSRQQELALDLPPPVVKVVSYEPAELAAYMQCGVATVRRYVKELITEGWAAWHKDKSRGKNRKLVIRLETPLVVESILPTSRREEDNLKLTQLEAFEMAVPPSPLLPLPLAEKGEATPVVEEISPFPPSYIRVPEHCMRAPLLAEDLAIVEHCVNEPDNLDIQGYNKTLNAYLTHLWTTQQENAFERGRKMVQIWLELRRKHCKPCHGDAVFSNNLPTAAYYASL